MTTNECGPAEVAVLLVAGIGERLHPLTLDRPKALVQVGRETMLGRSIRLLLAHGVREIILATGFEECAVREATRGLPVAVRYCPNSDYRTTQNAVSLLKCEEAVAGRSFYKLDGDLIFQGEVLSRLDGAASPLSVAVDRSVVLGAEEMKVKATSDGCIQAFGKGLDPGVCQGESIGVERVSGVAVSSLFHGLREAYGLGETQLYYEDVYGRLIARGLLEGVAVDVSDLPWAEVDTAEDLARARVLVAGLDG